MATDRRTDRGGERGVGDVGGTSRERLLTEVVDYIADHGAGTPSLRQIASAVGTSHRMLIYHFGSKEGLLAAAVDHIQHTQLATLTALMQREDLAPTAQAQQFWNELTQSIQRFGPLFFELAAASMRGAEHATHVPTLGVYMWLEPLTDLWRRTGAGPAEAASLARLGLAVANGLLLDVLLTGDADATNEAMQVFAHRFTPGA